MRNEIIKRNTIITVIGLVIFFFVSLFITSYNNRKKIENDLVYLSNVFCTQVLATESENEILQLINQYSTNPRWMDISIATSLGTIIYDSKTDNPSGNLTKDELHLANSLKVDQKRVYFDKMTQSIFYIKKVNNDIIVRTSVPSENNTGYILNSVFYMLLLIIGVLVFSIIYNQKTSDIIIDVFNDIRNHLRTVNEGNYERINPDHKFIEVKTSLEEINEINENISRSILKIKSESDKINFIINNMQQGIMIIDQKERLLIINEYALKSLHLDAKQKENAKFSEIPLNEELMVQLSHCISSGQNKTFDYHDKQSGNIYSFTITHLENVWLDEGENIKVMVVLIMDVTDERKNEEAKAEFIANASHELKTPITSISGFSELIINGYGECDEKTRGYIERIYMEAKRMQETIDDLLYLSNLEYQNNQVPLSEDVDLAKIINESVISHQDMATRNNIYFQLEIAPVSFKGNSTLIRNLVDNLVDNAIKYNKDFGLVIIKTKELEGKVQLIVGDTGIGMDEKHLTQIFDRFYRIDTSRSRLTGGTGLGLTIVKKVGAVHGAMLDVKSTLHEGTEFTITFNK